MLALAVRLICGYRLAAGDARPRQWPRAAVPRPPECRGGGAPAPHGSGQRQLRRQLKFLELKLRRDPFRWRAADQQRQRMLRIAERAPQRRQQCLIVGELALGIEHIDAVGAARIERTLHQLQVLRVILQQCLERSRSAPAPTRPPAPASPHCR